VSLEPGRTIAQCEEAQSSGDGDKRWAGGAPVADLLLQIIVGASQT